MLISSLILSPSLHPVTLTLLFSPTLHLCSLCSLCSFFPPHFYCNIHTSPHTSFFIAALTHSYLTLSHCSVPVTPTSCSQLHPTISLFTLTSHHTLTSTQHIPQIITTFSHISPTLHTSARRRTHSQSPTLTTHPSPSFTPGRSKQLL